MNQRNGIVAVALSAASYGTLALFGKLAVQAGLSVPALLFWRFLLGGIVLWGVVVFTRSPVPARRVALAPVSIGVLFAAMSSAYFTALVRAGAAYAVLTLYAYPAVVVAIEHLLGNRLTRRRAITVALAVAGVALLVHPGRDIDALGIGVGLLSAMFYGIYLVMTSRVMKMMPSLSATAIVVSAMVPLFAIAALGMHQNLRPSPHAWVILVVLAILSTAIPISLLNWGIARIGAPRAAVIGTLEPLTAVVLVTVFAGEHLDALQIAGGCLLVLSSAVPDRPPAVVLEA